MVVGHNGTKVKGDGDTRDHIVDDDGGIVVRNHLVGVVVYELHLEFQAVVVGGERRIGYGLREVGELVVTNIEGGDAGQLGGQGVKVAGESVGTEVQVGEDGALAYTERGDIALQLVVAQVKGLQTGQKEEAVGQLAFQSLRGQVDGGDGVGL